MTRELAWLLSPTSRSNYWKIGCMACKASNSSIFDVDGSYFARWLPNCTLITINWQFSQNLSKKGHNSVKILRITPLFELDLYLIMLDPQSVKFECNWFIPSKVIDRKPKVWRLGRGRRCWNHDPYVSSLLRRRYKSKYIWSLPYANTRQKYHKTL